MQSTEAKLLKSAVRDPETGCLRWSGAHTRTGYGHMRVDGRARPVHRLAFECWVGPIPEGLEIDHVFERGCRFRDCLEPSHLEAVTHRENLRRVSRRTTHCPAGHPYSGENLIMLNATKRRCRACHNAQQRQHLSRRITCEQCGVEISARSLSRHRKTHTGPK